MCNRNCNQGRLCPARLYPGIGKCSDLDNLAPGPIQDDPLGEKRDRILDVELAFVIVLALWAAFVIFVALDIALREGLFDWF